MEYFSIVFYEGTHLTPLTQDLDVLLPEPPLPETLRPLLALLPDALNPLKTRKSLSENFMRTVKEVEGEITLFLEENVKSTAQ